MTWWEEFFNPQQACLQSSNLLKSKALSLTGKVNVGSNDIDGIFGGVVTVSPYLVVFVFSAIIFFVMNVLSG